MLIRRHVMTATAMLLWSSLMHPATLRADDSESPLRAWEYEVKAAFLYNFVKFVKWPDNVQARTGPIDVVILGRDPFGARLDEALDSKLAHGRSFRVRRVRALRDLGDCEVVFLSSQMDEPAAAVLKALEGKPVLTIGDVEGLTDLGAVINISVEDRRVRFDVNLVAAKRHRLTVSSHLLRLARQVEPTGAQR